MAKNLVIVESPAKAKTLSRFLNKDYEVKSSFGHIRDLPKKGLNIDVENKFKPVYEVSADKLKVVAELKKASKNKEVWLASDEDREGEAIAWHLTQALKLNPSSTKRIVFHEITKPAIERAISEPRHIDIKLVEAQQARRVLDRLVGYELSPVLWKKVKGGLSAGRVQSVAVRLIVEREREIRDFKETADYKVTAEFKSKNEVFDAELNQRLKTSPESEKWLNDIKKSEFIVNSVEKKPTTRNPSAPFTTSTLQQEASRKLGFSVRQTMITAQRLYEAGHITYMRTDSVILSNLALKSTSDLIRREYGDKYLKTRQYQTKQLNAQEAHEAIRPTSFKIKSTGRDAQQNKLYRLIWQRALASQMSPAVLESTTANIAISNKPQQFIARGQILIFPGFYKVYGGNKEDNILPPLVSGEPVKLISAKAAETLTKRPPRYSEAGLVRKLEDLGIGRPSTYAPTISTIQTRGYVEKKDIEGSEKQLSEIVLKANKVSSTTVSAITGADRSKLTPTAIAEVVNDFLVKYFPRIVDYDFTARVENDFDNIARGEEKWDRMIAQFYKDFHPLIKKSNQVSREEVSKSKLIGTDPKSKLPISARVGRYGPMLVKGDVEDKSKKPDFAPLPDGTTIDTVTLEQALEQFKLPRVVGATKDGKQVKANIGRFGPYIQVDDTFVSIKPLDPRNISLKKAIELYEDRLKKDAAKNIKEFDSGIKILNGPYGPYVTDGKRNASIDKDINPSKLTEEKALNILQSAPSKKFIRKANKS